MKELLSCQIIRRYHYLEGEEMNILLRELRANFKSLLIWSGIALLFVTVGFSKFSAYEGNPELLAILDNLPPALVEAVHRALDKDPARRTATMEAFRATLERVAATLGPAAPHDASLPVQNSLPVGWRGEERRGEERRGEPL